MPIGSVISAANDVKQGYWQNAFNLINTTQSIRQNKLQREAFEWQKYYDLNQTQIRVDDMAKAGLNPILAAGSAGATGVSGVSAQNASTDVAFGQLNALKELDLQKTQLKSENEIAKESNETAKEVAETNAKASKEVAEIQADTAKANAQLNADTQSAIATANNDALKDVRSAQSRYDNAMSDKQEFENEFVRQYNKLTGRLHSSKSVIEFLDNGATSVAAWLGTSVEFAKKFIKNAKKMAKKGITDLSQIDLSKVEWE
ncbi:MAG: hypothetical protein HDR35_04725 [Treponema sp.]|nr:hypothetical protein [Treponema sp.]